MESFSFLLCFFPLENTLSSKGNTKLFAQKNITRRLLPRTNLNDVVYLRYYCNLMVFQLE